MITTGLAFPPFMSMPSIWHQHHQSDKSSGYVGESINRFYYILHVSNFYIICLVCFFLKRLVNYDKIDISRQEIPILNHTTCRVIISAISAWFFTALPSINWAVIVNMTMKQIPWYCEDDPRVPGWGQIIQNFPSIVILVATAEVLILWTICRYALVCLHPG